MEGPSRVVVERVRPEIDCGAFAIKRLAGETLVVEADILVDGHDALSGEVLYRHVPEENWLSAPMKALGNDRWRGEFRATEPGQYEYTVQGWIDRFGTWRREMIRRVASEQDVHVECLSGANLIEDAASRAAGEDASKLRDLARMLRDQTDGGRGAGMALTEEVATLVQQYPDRRFAGRHAKPLRLVVDRERAGFSAWYEIFPRSCSSESGRHGTLRDCEARLPYIASMGFDVLYLPPVHPIGHTFRKGRNNETAAAAGDVGSPWAIGSEDGGHTSIHPDLGTMDDFKRLISKAKEYGLEIALDLAFQCSPDHPYVRQHPEWFRHRPDGTIQYAENPPKKYQDIFPLDFESPEWWELWQELKRVIVFWIDHGVAILRVDNPHTKALPFWEWVIAEIKQEHPEVLFLAEAFTRPRLMYRLAKLGFSQSYTYFTWRNTKEELTRYFRELTETEVREFFRPNLWPNTPDILPEFLQVGGRAAFMMRLVLAATLGANYGIYGPAFELCENAPREQGGEEYINSEKYELKRWDLSSAWSLKDFIARVNRIRRENPALHRDANLRFHETDNPAVICYSKATDDLSDIIIVICNLDAAHTQAGWVTLDLGALGLDATRTFQAHDLLGDGRYLWHGSHNYFELVPGSLPAHVMKVRKWVRTERDFDYYL
ncbi:MAG TPA: alpha-1,4-glucan--maltose-1-phosphate maltosyltransferase [Candidatus Acidoferrales bacterium]|nr:alpha-1,4-glucan--maltose-1-phosphate maltosyltransferase [Candidatus Acidoferrales bacterium]